MNVSVPKRILSLAPSNTEILYALGLGDSVVGVTEYCLTPPQARLKPQLKGWVSIPPEKILAFEPDLVVTSTICQDALRKKLTEAKIPLLHLDPRDLSGITRSFFQLGQATGKEKEALALIRKFEQERSAIQARVPATATRPRVYCEEWHKPPSVSGNWVPELMADAGASYFPVAAGELSRPVRLEEVQDFGPEIVILSICGKGLDSDPAQILQRVGWEKLDAVKGKWIFTLDDSLLNCPGPRVLEGARAIQQILEAFRSGVKPPDSVFLQNL
jgi:iron complex transport system substrate-binding protein